MRLARSLGWICAVAALVAVDAAAAQPFHVSIGPASRTVEVDPFYGGARAWDAIAIEGSWLRPMSARLRFLAGAGLVAGESIEEHAYSVPAVPDLAIMACLPDHECPAPVETSRTILGGSMVHARLGLAFEEGWFLAAAGVVGARSAGSDRDGVGGFAELRLRPIARMRQLSVGVLAYQVAPSPAGQRAVVTPTIGLRF